MFAGSYTFWSQAIIAEVYALHWCLIALTLLLLLRWQKEPTLPRLAVFFAVYAIAFGNHLAMILLAPAYALFLLLAAPHGWRSMLRPRIVALAGLVAVAGASQYSGTSRALWFEPPRPASWREALANSGSTSRRATGATQWSCRCRPGWPSNGCGCGLRSPAAVRKAGDPLAAAGAAAILEGGTARATLLILTVSDDRSSR